MRTADASLRRPRLAPPARSVRSAHPAGEAAKRRAAQTPRAALVVNGKRVPAVHRTVDQLCLQADAIFLAGVRVLAVVKSTGPRKRTVLANLGGEETIGGMIKLGLLRKFGSKRGTTWGYGTLTRLATPERARVSQAVDEALRG